MVFNKELKTENEIKLEIKIQKLEECINKFKEYDKQRTKYVHDLEDELSEYDEYLKDPKYKKLKEKIKNQKAYTIALEKKYQASKISEDLSMADVVNKLALHKIIQDVNKYTPIELSKVITKASDILTENKELKEKVKKQKYLIDSLLSKLNTRNDNS